MKYILSFLLAACTHLAYSQSESDSRAALDKLRNYYNGVQFSEIHNMLDGPLKQSLTPDKAVKFFQGIHQELGPWTGTDFLRSDKNIHFYRAAMERGKLIVSLGLNRSGLIEYIYFEPEPETAEVRRNVTPMKLPFKEEWFVFWGGDTKSQNYHVESPQQRHAFDIVIMDAKNRTCKKPCKSNEDFYAFGKNIYAVSDAEVAAVVEGVEDNVPGVLNPAQLAGNSVVLKTAAGEYILFAHLKKGTVQVKEGSRVKAGDLLGQCGNSGNSSEPHLHLHMQDAPWGEAAAKGIKCYFESMKVVNGSKKEEVRQDYSPVKGDRIRFHATNP